MDLIEMLSLDVTAGHEGLAHCNAAKSVDQEQKLNAEATKVENALSRIAPLVRLAVPLMLLLN